MKTKRIFLSLLLAVCMVIQTGVFQTSANVASAADNEDLASIRVNIATKSYLLVGEEYEFAATPTPSDAEYVWNVFEEDGVTPTDKAVISEDGVLTAKATGYVTVVAGKPGGSVHDSYAMFILDTTKSYFIINKRYGSALNATAGSLNMMAPNPVADNQLWKVSLDNDAFRLQNASTGQFLTSTSATAVGMADDAGAGESAGAASQRFTPSGKINFTGARYVDNYVNSDSPKAMVKTGQFKFTAENGGNVLSASSATALNLAAATVESGSTQGGAHQEFILVTDGDLKVFNPADFRLATGTVYDDGGGYYNNNAGVASDKVFDGNTGTYYDALDPSGFVGLEFDSPKVISALRIYPRNSYAVRIFKGLIQGSNDKVNYVNLYEFNIAPTERAWTDVFMGNATAYKFYRFQSPPFGFCNVAELELYENASEPLPLGVSARSFYDLPAKTAIYSTVGPYADSAFEGPATDGMGGVSHSVAVGNGKGYDYIVNNLNVEVTGLTEENEWFKLKLTGAEFVYGEDSKNNKNFKSTAPGYVSFTKQNANEYSTLIYNDGTNDLFTIEVEGSELTVVPTAAGIAASNATGLIIPISAYIETYNAVKLYVSDQNQNSGGNSLPTDEITINSLLVKSAEWPVKETRRLTPTMGWASWNNFGLNINEAAIKGQVDALVSTGLRDAGYVYVNIDDGFQNGRDDVSGLVNYNTRKFPKGMKELADYIHQNGLKAGMYTDAGDTSCGNRREDTNFGLYVGLYDPRGWANDDKDIRMFLHNWSYDYIKIDNCGLGNVGMTNSRYIDIGNVIRQVSAEDENWKVFNICSKSIPGAWAPDVADSWRTSGDISTSWDRILSCLDSVKPLAQYHGPGHVNDPDMLEVGRGSLTYDQNKSHFSMWCMVSAPLILGNDLRSITPQVLSILENKELIAIDQDPACLPAKVVKTFNSGSGEVWVKDLGEQGSLTKAVALFNRSGSAITMDVDWMNDLGLFGVRSVRDLWQDQEITASDGYSATIPAYGIVVLKVTADSLNPLLSIDLLSPWYNKNPLPSKVKINSPTSISITTDQGDLWRISPDNELSKQPVNLHLIDIPKTENVELTTELTFSPTANYHGAGLVFYLDNYNVISVIRRYHSSAAPYNCFMMQLSTGDGSGQAASSEYRAADYAVSTPKCYLKLVKNGSSITGYYREDENMEWRLATTYTNANIGGADKISVGIISSHGNASPTDITATFENFMMDGVLYPFAENIVKGVTETTVDTFTGAAPALPAKVQAEFFDGTTADTDVVWDAVDPAQYAVPGAFSVFGTVDKSSLKAVAKVTVHGISADLSIVGATAKAEYTVGSGDDKPAQTYMAIIAVYEEGRLVKTISETGSVNAGELLKLSLETSISDTCLVKAFLWDGLTYAPLCPAAAYEIAIGGIYGYADWAAMNNDLSADYKLMTDIDFGGITYTSIGSSVTPFSGVFDGNGHTVSNMSGSVALFDTNNGTIKGLNVSGAVLSTALDDLGAIVCFNNGVVTECSVSGGSVTARLRAGGVVGRNMNGALIEKCVSSAAVNSTATSESFSGGVVGCNGHLRLPEGGGDVALVRDCYSTGDVSGGWNVGGIAGGSLSPAIVENCYATGNINNVNPGRWVGGIVGNFQGVASNGEGGAVRSNVAMNGSIYSQRGTANAERIVSGDAQINPNNIGLDTTLVNGAARNGSLASTDKNGLTKSAAELADAETYKAIGWDFDTVWVMDAVSGRPTLRWLAR